MGSIWGFGRDGYRYVCMGVGVSVGMCVGEWIGGEWSEETDLELVSTTVEVFLELRTYAGIS